MSDPQEARPFIETLAASLSLGELLERARALFGTYELVAHWKQGEFHHDVVLTLPAVESARHLPGPVLVVSTNCNGGVKSVLSLAEVPERGGLWRLRCPDNPEFEGIPPEVLAEARTHHYFDPCELLLPDARSELRPEFRRRQRGGGWEPSYE